MLDQLKRLYTEGLSILVFEGDTDLYSSYQPGVRPLLELVDWFPFGLGAATVADRVVGACAARIFAYLRPAAVLGGIGSTEAAHILFTTGINHSFEETVPQILNRDNTGVCPFERLSTDCTDVHELIRRIRARLAEPNQA
ncbi:MAG: DUF1893 domain-containing protein [candidate division WOR-3 bacterium]